MVIRRCQVNFSLIQSSDSCRRRQLELQSERHHSGDCDRKEPGSWWLGSEMENTVKLLFSTDYYACFSGRRAVGRKDLDSADLLDRAQMLQNPTQLTTNEPAWKADALPVQRFSTPLYPEKPTHRCPFPTETKPTPFYIDSMRTICLLPDTLNAY
jgi:hypothetical protein